MVRLSIIILSYNTCDVTLQCLGSVVTSLKQEDFITELIIVDNHSQDGSPEAILEFAKIHTSQNLLFRVILNKENRGFTKGNNQAIDQASGTYILCLNSDVLIKEVVWSNVLAYMDLHTDVGALTVKVILKSGLIDPASHRGFPSLWNAFTYLSGLEKITSKIPILNNIFGGYHLTAKRLDTLHEIDAPSGAFFLVRRSLLNSIHGFDETFFMYGEDIDLAYRIKSKGKKIMYLPQHVVLHLKYQSGLSHSSNKARIQTRVHFYQAMKIFFRKHYAQQYPYFIQKCTEYLIDIVSLIKK